MTRKQPVSNQFSNIIIGSAWLSWLCLTALVCGGICPADAADEWSKSMSAGHRALQRKDYIAADKWFSEAVEQSGRNNAETLGLLRSLSSLAFVYQQENKLAEAVALRKRALSVAEKISGPDHPDVAEALNGLAEVYQLQGNYAESVPLYERAIAIREAKLGTGHAAVASSLNSLAEAARAHADRLRLSELEMVWRRFPHVRSHHLPIATAPTRRRRQRNRRASVVGGSCALASVPRERRFLLNQITVASIDNFLIVDISFALRICSCFVQFNLQCVVRMHQRCEPRAAPFVAFVYEVVFEVHVRTAEEWQYHESNGIREEESAQEMVP